MQIGGRSGAAFAIGDGEGLVCACRDGENNMGDEPESKLDKANRLMWLISGIVTAILMVVIMIIIMVRGSGY
jgi:hypothetical protein